MKPNNFALTQFLLVWALLSFGSGASALSLSSENRSDSPDTPVTLALKWYPGFQFAGYYAALHKGFYAEEGLSVTLTTPDEGIFPLESVLAGHAQYGIGGSNLITARTSGDPVVVLASIVQHSPIILLSRHDSQLLLPSDYIGKTIMSTEHDLPEILAMFTKEGLDLDRIHFVPLTGLKEMVSGKADAGIHYITNEPNQMQKMGIEPYYLRPINYGIDFYGDAVFTTEQEITQHPERVEAFLRATLKGWEYAFTHVDEMADYLLTLSTPDFAVRDKSHLLFEAEQYRKLILPGLIEIGHTNPLRWEKMAHTMAELNLIPKDYSLEGLIYTRETSSPFFNRNMWIMFFVIFLTSLFALMLFWAWNSQLRRSVRMRTNELNRSESQLKRQNALFDTLLANLPIGVFMVEAPSGKPILANKKAQDLLGRGILPDANRENIKELYMAFRKEDRVPYPVDEMPIIKGMQGIAAHIDDMIVVKPDGNQIQLEVFGSPILNDQGKAWASLVSFIDITERVQAMEARQQLQEQLHHSQKMESIGRLAGGIAHDFNNMLGVIIGYSELTLVSLSESDPLAEKIRIIHSVAEKSADLTRQLLGFARRQTVAPVQINLNNAVSNMLNMMQRIIGEEIQLCWQPCNEPAEILMDPSQLDQIVTNLCINARDAISNSSTGSITLTTLLEHLPHPLRGQNGEIPPGSYVVLSVKDNGAGMTKEVLEKIFEPFFTTKETGKGVGLGLATLFGIVSQNGGYIDVISKPNTGTTFLLYFPDRADTNPQNSEPSELNAPTLPETSHSHSILVVEDEPGLNRMIREMLEALHYTVYSSTDPVAAITLFKEHQETIDILLTDVVMPKQNGKELAETIKKLKPSIKVAFMSGYTADIIAHHGVLEDGYNYIQKPFTLKTLSELISQLTQDSPA